MREGPSLSPTGQAGRRHVTSQDKSSTGFLWVWAAIACLAIAATLFWFWDMLPFGGWLETLFQALGQAETFTRIVNRLGWAGPLGLILINAAQIVIAPLPNYAIFVVAGLLYGPFWGGVYGIAGMVLGGVCAMLLTRRFGRPLAERMVGAARLDRWNQMQATQSVVSWSILFLAPVGDIPYFLAGLAQVSVGKIVAISAITRGPSIFLIAAASSGATGMTWTQLVLAIVAMVVVFGLLGIYQQQVLGWFDRHVQSRFFPSARPSLPDEVE
jgi:uncharacterized membrane protein YdjX (TVP38/TMEM64 family)